MENLMFWGMLLISLLVIGMSIYILIAQAYLNKLLMDKFNDQKMELRRAFGWEEYNWAENFGEYARKVDKLIKFKEEIERLEVIKKAIEVQKLSDLNRKKEQVEQEIKKLEKKQ
nr:MAG TPA: CHD-like protein [Caudoviricetes sp.]